MSNPFFTPEQEAEFAARVAVGEKIRTIARSLEIYPQTIRNAIRRHAQRLAGTVRNPGKRRQYTLNESAFDGAENNPDAAYFIGLIMADGCITHRTYSPRLSIGFSGDDGVMVERFQQFLGTDHPFYVSSRIGGFRTKSSKFTRISIDSKRIAAKLAEYGVGARKSLTAKVKRLEMSADFWRGAVDGDGHLTIPKGKHLAQPSVGLVGSHAMVSQFVEFVRSFTECAAKVAPMHSIFRFETKGRFAVSIIRKLYGQGRISMPRKQAVADTILSNFLDNGRPVDNPIRPGRSKSKIKPS